MAKLIFLLIRLFSSVFTMILILASFISSAILCYVGIYILSATLPGSFLAARFNRRSNHSVAARQIGGLALIPAILVTMLMFGADLGIPIELIIGIATASLLLWVTGILDDRFDLPVYIRFGCQLVASGIVFYGLGPEFRLLPDMLPHWLEAAFVIATLMAAINVTNFMDGLDLMTVTGLGIPMTGILILTLFKLSNIESGAIASVLAGGLLGFSFFNRPPARIFLGDSGSLPLGLIAGTTLLVLAQQTHIVVAVVIPLYYLLDTATTIILRMHAGENILKAHSKHAYQVAKRSGWSVAKIIYHVSVLNITLMACAASILKFNHLLSQLVFLIIAIVATLFLLLDFRGRFRKL